MSDLIALPPAQSLTSHPVTIMISEIADIVGRAGDPDAETKATRYLDRAADQMNLSGVYMFQRKEATITGFDDGAKTLELPDDWGWPETSLRLYNGANKLVGATEWLDWELFQVQIPEVDTGSFGIPEWASIKSELDDTLSLFPYVGTSEVTTIKLPYIARIQRPTESEELFLTPESRECLILGGEAFFMRQRHAKYPQAWMPFWRMFERAITQAKATSWRYRQSVFLNARPDELGRVESGESVTAGGQTRFFIGP